MTHLYIPREYEPLKLELINQFNWSREDGEHRPEAIAFLTGSRIVGGHARNLAGKTAVMDALFYLHDHFAIAALTPAMRPDRMLVMTMQRENGEPCQPSSSLLRDARLYLKQSPDTPLRAIVLGEKGGALSCEI